MNLASSDELALQFGVVDERPLQFLALDVRQLALKIIVKFFRGHRASAFFNHGLHGFHG